MSPHQPEGPSTDVHRTARRVWCGTAVAACILWGGLDLAAQTAVLTTARVQGPGLFGRSLAIDGDYALVGAPGDANPANYTGSVLVYHRVQGVWREEQKLSGAGGALLDYFGQSVAIAGKVAVVGAPAPLSKTNPTGTVHVFRHNGTSWVEEASFQRGQGFGSAVAIDGNRIVVGAPMTRLPSFDGAGAVWVFEHSGNTWAQQAMLVAGDASTSDHFGTSVAIEGDHILVGAPTEGDSANLSAIGSMYAFHYVNGTWSQTQKLRASAAAEQSFFARRIAIDNGVALVGAHGKKAGGYWASGQAYVFKLGTAGWVETQVLNTPWPATNTQFGLSVAISGDLLCVYARGRDGKGNTGGAVHPFRWDGQRYAAEPPFQQATPLNQEEGFGDELAASGSTLLAAAYIQNAPPLVEGSVFVFDTAPRFHTWVQPMPIVVRDTAKLALRQGIAGSPMLLCFGFSGTTHIPLPWPGSSIDIVSPLVVGVADANSSGAAQWEVAVPAEALGVKLWIQGFQVPGKTRVESSNVVFSEIVTGG
ncbi:MAG: hypothetical protein H6837_18320 [Planctomycetes bacterium]|nr:hypothetical protein [Planctomycetota bacterium]